jgi:hypothetical protein
MTALLQLVWQLSGGGAPQAELKGHSLRRPAAQAPCLDCLQSRRRRGIAALQLQVRSSGSPRARAVWAQTGGRLGAGWAFNFWPASAKFLRVLKSFLVAEDAENAWRTNVIRANHSSKPEPLLGCFLVRQSCPWCVRPRVTAQHRASSCMPPAHATWELPGACHTRWRFVIRR